MAPAVYFLGGQPKRAAEYQPEDRATVVFVDDRGNAIEQNSLRTRQAIADMITADLMEQANPGAIFMHCLPAHRGEEVVGEVVDGPQSRIWPQAENRMHTTRGLLAWLWGQQ